MSDVPRPQAGDLCEWPAGMKRCNRPARAYVYRITLSGQWGRNVCGIHARVAERRGTWQVQR